MNHSQNNLIFFTSDYPYGKGEQFIETEINYLSKKFNKIYIFPLAVKGNRRDVPNNVEVIHPELYGSYKTIMLILKNIHLILYVFTYTFFHTNNKKVYLKNFKKLFYYLLHKINDAYWLENKLLKIANESTVYYSYWFNTWCTLLSIVKYRNKCKIEFISRIHNGDFELVRKKDGLFPFREFELKSVDKIYSISNHGKESIKSYYPKVNFDVLVSRLGVDDYGNNTLNRNKGYFHIVSCSFLSKIKRVDLIIEILASIKNVKVLWTHMGTGELELEILDLVKSKIDPENIKVEFKGMVSNLDVIKFYKTAPVDLFINTSELEGIPVSMMEAISFGIPCIGCDVGGVSEIVNSETGFLFKKDFQPTEISECINLYYQKSEQEKINFRNNVKLFWKENYNADKNYSNFIKTIVTNQIV